MPHSKNHQWPDAAVSILTERVARRCYPDIPWRHLPSDYRRRCRLKAERDLNAIGHLVVPVVPGRGVRGGG